MEYIYSMVSLVTTRINIYGDEKDVSFPPSQAGASADQLEVLLTGRELLYQMLGEEENREFAERELQDLVNRNTGDAVRNEE